MMPPTGPGLLQSPGGPFEELCRALGGDLATWRARETLERVYIPRDFHCTVEQVSRALPQILHFVESYGEALEEASLGIPDLPGRSLPLGPGLQRKELEAFLATFDAQDELSVQASIVKPCLLARELGTARLTALAGTQAVLIFYRQFLEKILRQPTHELEKMKLWPAGPAQKIVVLAPEWNGFLEGPYLAIVGGDPVPGWGRLSPRGEAPRNPFELAPEEIAKARNDHLRWEAEWLTSLTPLHLLVDGEAPPTDPVAQALLLHRANLCLLFSADRTVRTGAGLTGLRAIYSGGQQKAEVDLSPLEDFPPGDKLRKNGVEILESLVGWAYARRFTSDRLTFLQTEIARALRGVSATKAFRELLRQAARIGEDLDIRWRAFIEGKVDAFTAAIRALEDDVASTAQAFSEQTSALIRSLSETMLAAVAVVLGSFIATVFDKDSDPEILRIGLLLYLVYLLVFPVGYNMIERWRSFAVARRHFQERRQRFETGIDPATVQGIVDKPLERSERRFKRWFGLTLATYLIVAVFLWMAIPPPFPSHRYDPPKAAELPPANEDLRAAKVFAQGQVIGAEDVAVDRAGRLYTGTADGRVARVTLRPDGTADVLTFARTGGRPFGLRFDPAGNLIVAVANKGLVSIDPAGKTTVLVKKVHGVPLGFVNTLDIARDGKIYFSESAPGYSPTRYLDELLESRPRGRLLVYDPQAPEEKVSVLLENLFFSNGVALTTDQRAVLVAETYAYRIRRYWLEGPKQGTWDVFAENLPGFPDNLTSDRRGGYWLALPTVRKALLDKIHPHPFLKEQLVKLPRFLWPKAVPYGLVVVLDENGRIVRSLHDPGGKTVRGVTTARPAGDKLYLGSFEGEWLAAAPL